VSWLPFLLTLADSEGVVSSAALEIKIMIVSPK